MLKSAARISPSSKLLSLLMYRFGANNLFWNNTLLLPMRADADAVVECLWADTRRISIYVITRKFYGIFFVHPCRRSIALSTRQKEEGTLRKYISIITRNVASSSSSPTRTRKKRSYTRNLSRTERNVNKRRIVVVLCNALHLYCKLALFLLRNYEKKRIKILIRVASEGTYVRIRRRTHSVDKISRIAMSMECIHCTAATMVHKKLAGSQNKKRGWNWRNEFKLFEQNYRWNNWK